MSLHFAILFWLALIFLVAATFILVLMKKTGKESKKESYLSFTVILYIFRIRYFNIHIYIWCAINEIHFISSLKRLKDVLDCFLFLIDISHSHTLIFKICFSLACLLKIKIIIQGYLHIFLQQGAFK